MRIFTGMMLGVEEPLEEVGFEIGLVMLRIKERVVVVIASSLLRDELILVHFESSVEFLAHHALEEDVSFDARVIAS